MLSVALEKDVQLSSDRPSTYAIRGETFNDRLVPLERSIRKPTTIKTR